MYNFNMRIKKLLHLYILFDVVCDENEGIIIVRFLSADITCMLVELWIGQYLVCEFNFV